MQSKPRRNCSKKHTSDEKKAWRRYAERCRRSEQLAVHHGCGPCSMPPLVQAVKMPPRMQREVPEEASLPSRRYLELIEHCESGNQVEFKQVVV